MQLLNAEKLIKQFVSGSDRIALAVSGGADSMCLAAFVLSRPFLNRANITILNVNHNIRGENSKNDSAFVERFARKQNVKFERFDIDVPFLSSQSGRSLETEAREARYAAFKDYAAKNNIKYVLTAHHELDDAESVLMHLFRGSGLNGLCGMEILRGGWLFRPLLTTSKAEIDSFNRINGVEFITDETNSDTKYDRNFIRSEVISLIESRYKGVVRSIAALKEEAAAVKEYLDSHLKTEKIEPAGKTGARIPVELLEDGTILSARYVLAALNMLDVKSDFSRQNINDVLALARKRNGAAIDLPNNLTAVKEYGKIYLGFIEPHKKEEQPEISFACGEFDFEKAAVKVEKTENVQFSPECVSGKSYSKTLYADLKKIPNGAVIRFRREGDVFKPFGGGTKKLKEYFIDKKIPALKRDFIPLIAFGSEILAVTGFEISDKIRVEEGSEIISISLKKLS